MAQGRARRKASSQSTPVANHACSQLIRRDVGRTIIWYLQTDLSLANFWTRTVSQKTAQLRELGFPQMFASTGMMDRRCNRFVIIRGWDRLFSTHTLIPQSDFTFLVQQTFPITWYNTAYGSHSPSFFCAFPLNGFFINSIIKNKRFVWNTPLRVCRIRQTFYLWIKPLSSFIYFALLSRYLSRAIAAKLLVEIKTLIPCTKGINLHSSSPKYLKAFMFEVLAM